MAALCLGIWSAVLALLPRRAVFAESNYQSNLIRLQDFLRRGTADTLLVGSSISGRLLPVHFRSAGATNWSNLGLDGSGPALGIDLALSRPFLPRQILVEANLLAIPPGPNDVVLREHAAGFTFKLASALPIFRADSRPTALLYNLLKEKADARHAPVQPPGPRPAAINTPAPQPAQAPIQYDRTTPAQKQAHATWLRDRIQTLSSRGVRVVFVRYPVADPTPPSDDLARQIATESGFPYVDLRQEFLQRGVPPTFTDGTHLTSASAQVAAQILTEKLRENLPAIR